MPWYDKLKSVVKARSWPAHAEWIASDRVTDNVVGPEFEADRTYLRVWLSQAQLEWSRNWFTEWHPVVHSAVLREAGSSRDEIMTVLSPGSIPGFAERAQASETVNKPLTPLLPFGGGTVSINAGLVALKGDNAVRTLIDVVSGFGGLVTTTALATGVSIANQVADAFEKLLNIDENSGTIAYDGTLAGPGGGAPTLKPGYLAVLDQEPVAPLWVRDDHLLVWPGGQAPSAVPAGNFLLIRLESRTDRDDWRHLAAIEEPLLAARAAVDSETRRAHYQRAIIAARTSADLHEADRIRIAVALRDLRETDQGLGAASVGPETLDEVAANATLPVEDALEQAPSLSVLLA
jgi:hypothetical protein